MKKVTTASTTTEIKKFEVGKIYFPCVLFEKPRIKITKRTAKTVHYKIERFNGEFDCETRANILIFDGSEHFYSGYLNRSYYALDAEETATETVETENTVNAEDSSTVKAAKEELIYVNNQIKSVQRNIAYYVEQIKEYLGCIAKCENFISDYGVDLYDLQNKAAALENEIANRKLIDAIDDIGGSADAVNATVEAIIELNSVNAQADKTVEIVPVTFEIQNFAADVNIAEDAEFDSKIKANVEEYANLKAAETEIEKQIEELEKKLKAINKASLKIIDVINEEEGNLTRWIRRNVKFKNMTLVGAYGGKHCSDEYSIYASMGVESSDILLSAGAFELGTYSTVKNLKVAIRELAAAVERGEETFTFPADETADK